MFNKFAIADNKIRILRFNIKYKEELSESEYEDFALNESEKQAIIAGLERRKAIYEVIQIEVPSYIEQYDNMEWNDGWDKALLMMNNDTEYQIKQYKKQLMDMDYKTSKYADGEYTQLEWVEIVKGRKAIREKIRELEQQII